MAPPDDAHIHEKIGALTAEVDMLIVATGRSEEKFDVSTLQMNKRKNQIVNRVDKAESNFVVVQDDVKEMN